MMTERTLQSKIKKEKAEWGKGKAKWSQKLLLKEHRTLKGDRRQIPAMMGTNIALTVFKNVFSGGR